MNILIKGMAMPSRCCECVLSKLSPTGERLICNYTLSTVPWDETPLTDCPLVPVPPHGRLIDAAALKASLVFAEETADWAVPALRAVLMVIDEMPTIIPAEEGET